VRVLVVDDHPVVREGLRALLLRGGFSVVGMASEALSALELAGENGRGNGRGGRGPSGNFRA
jgi:DNA-binding NarL/FixJ family response regulator